MRDISHLLSCCSASTSMLLLLFCLTVVLDIRSDAPFELLSLVQPHGRAFRIIDKELMMTDAIPAFFVQTKFRSFTRQLSGWGFKRLHRLGPDFGCYYQECFLHGLPILTNNMKRVPSNQGKLAPYPEGEPDFYKISSFHPLPSQAIAYDPEDASNSKASKQGVIVSTTMIYQHRNQCHIFKPMTGTTLHEM